MSDRIQSKMQTDCKPHKFFESLSKVNDCFQDSFDFWMVHNYFFGFILLYVILLGLIDPLLIVYGYLVPASLCVFATGAFNTWGHGKGMQWAGYRTWETNDRSVNHHLVNLITFGEGWHNNHHSRPGDYTNSMEWWEWDINAWIIRLIKQ